MGLIGVEPAQRGVQGLHVLQIEDEELVAGGLVQVYQTDPNQGVGELGPGLPDQFDHGPGIGALARLRELGPGIVVRTGVEFSPVDLDAPWLAAVVVDVVVVSANALELDPVDPLRHAVLHVGQDVDLGRGHAVEIDGRGAEALEGRGHLHQDRRPALRADSGCLLGRERRGEGDGAHPGGAEDGGKGRSSHGGSRDRGPEPRRRTGTVRGAFAPLGRIGGRRGWNRLRPIVSTKLPSRPSDPQPNHREDSHEDQHRTIVDAELDQVWDAWNTPQGWQAILDNFGRHVEAKSGSGSFRLHRSCASAGGGKAPPTAIGQTSMNSSEMIRMVQELSGERDVELLQIPPAEILYDKQVLHPLRVIRRGSRYLVEVAEYPGEWWIGEFDGDTLYVWGSYGTLDQAAAQH